MKIRESSSDDNLQRRFIEFRYDGDRTISGVAMRYGDVAELPWGDKERFEPGAFGAVGSSDVILNFQHDRRRPLARTGGGGLTMDDSSVELRLTAKLPKTGEANDAIELVKENVIRGFSVEFLPESWNMEEDVMVITKAELKGIGLVDRPAYSGSRINPRSENPDMNEEQIQKLIEAALAKRAEDSDPIDAAALAGSISEGVTTSVTEQVKSQVGEQLEASIKERDEAAEAQKRAEDEKAELESKATEDRAQIEADAEKRAELIASVRSAELLPKDFDPKGKTVKEILVVAAGDEVKEAEGRSEDYLEAKIEGIIERRAAASNGGLPAPRNTKIPTGDTKLAGASVLTNVLMLPNRPTLATVRGADKSR